MKITKVSSYIYLICLLTLSSACSDDKRPPTNKATAVIDSDGDGFDDDADACPADSFNHVGLDTHAVVGGILEASSDGICDTNDLCDEQPATYLEFTSSSTLADLMVQIDIVTTGANLATTRLVGGISHRMYLCGAGNDGVLMITVTSGTDSEVSWVLHNDVEELLSGTGSVRIEAQLEFGTLVSGDDTHSWYTIPSAQKKYGWHFDGSGAAVTNDWGEGQDSLAVYEVAGMVPQRFWNNHAPDSNSTQDIALSPMELKDDTGMLDPLPLTAVMGYGDDGTGNCWCNMGVDVSDEGGYCDDLLPASSGDYKLTNTIPGNKPMWMFTNIPASIRTEDHTYSVYVYFGFVDGTGTCTWQLTDDNEALVDVNADWDSTDESSPELTIANITSYGSIGYEQCTEEVTDTCNYYVFSHLTYSQFRLRCTQDVNNSDNSTLPANVGSPAIQIIED